jgi:hypothetical protein
VVCEIFNSRSVAVLSLRRTPGVVNLSCPGHGARWGVLWFAPPQPEFEVNEL